MNLIGILFLVGGAYVLLYWFRAMSAPMTNRPAAMRTSIGPLITLIAGLVLALIGVLILVT
jgi:hypothetical protein